MKNQEPELTSINYTSKYFYPPKPYPKFYIVYYTTINGQPVYTIPFTTIESAKLFAEALKENNSKIITYSLDKKSTKIRKIRKVKK